MYPKKVNEIDSCYEDLVAGLTSLAVSSRRVQPNLIYVQLLIYKLVLFLYAGAVVTRNDTICCRHLSLPERFNIFRRNFNILFQFVTDIIQFNKWRHGKVFSLQNFKEKFQKLSY